MSPQSAPAASGGEPPRRRVGLLGGTFDPPHIGHVLTGQRVGEALGLDEVWFVVAHDPWQKSDIRVVTPSAIRLRMTEAACYASRQASRPLATPILRVSDVELEAGGPSYSADTLRTLSARYTDDSFSLIVGSDTAAQLQTWQDSAWLRENASFVVAQRGGDASEPTPGFQTTVVAVPRLEVSSSEIRNRIGAGLTVKHMVPDEVLGLIRAHGLYHVPPALRVDEV